MYAKKIKMRSGKENSNDLLEIDSIYVDGCNNPGFFKKDVLHKFLKKYPGSVKVYRVPYPDLVPATSINGELYVKSVPDNTRRDNLLSLPRED